MDFGAVDITRHVVHDQSTPGTLTSHAVLCVVDLDVFAVSSAHTHIRVFAHHIVDSTISLISFRSTHGAKTCSCGAESGSVVLPTFMLNMFYVCDSKLLYQVSSSPVMKEIDRLGIQDYGMTYGERLALGLYPINLVL